MVYAKAYAAALIVFLGIDYVWLSHVADEYFASQLGDLLRDDVNFAVAGGFYLAYVGGIVYFAVSPALARRSWLHAAINGALFGLLAYGTYDMTNLATLRDWPVAMSLVDMTWGTALTATAAAAGHVASRPASSRGDPA